MWIWQQPAWPDFDWDQKVIAPLLREAHFNQGLLLGRMGLENQQQATLDTLLANIVHSSAIEGEKLLLKRYFKDGKMIQKTLGIMEPDLNEIYTGKVDLVIVPGVAFDRAKNRLGRGRGYYDRFFKKMKPTKIGVGFDFQLLSSVPAAKHDIAMDIIVTPSETIK